MLAAIAQMSSKTKAYTVYRFIFPFNYECFQICIFAAAAAVKFLSHVLKQFFFSVRLMNNCVYINYLFFRGRKLLWALTQILNILSRY